MGMEDVRRENQKNQYCSSSFFIYVVASEIGALAGSTNDAANQIQQISNDAVESIQDAMQSVSSTSEENSAEIVSTSELLVSVDADMKNIGSATRETFSAISTMKNALSSYRV